MCGIAGAVSPDGVEASTIRQMRDALTHRGPDDDGLYQNEAGTVGLGSRRLAILDLSKKGAQPIANEDETVWVAYNGEIYNYPSLRDQLENNGHTFASETDTEVVVHAYEEWGVDCLERFNGMFAFTVWDTERERLFGARDRLGIKPFHYAHQNGRLSFGSEIKAVLADDTVDRSIDPEALRQFFTYRYIPAPLSIWQDVRKLQPGHYLLYDGEELDIHQYWELETDTVATDDDPVEEIESLLDDAVEKRLRSDVPLGVLLSGGIDSSVITALTSAGADDTSTFSVGFEPAEYSELEYAKEVAEEFGTDHSEHVLSPERIREMLDEIVHVYDEPLGDSSIFPTYLLMGAVSDDVTVALGGDGGDEIFAGYTWYTKYLRYQQFDEYDGLLARVHDLVSGIPNAFDNKLLRAVESRTLPFTYEGADRYRMIMAPRFDDTLFSDLVTDAYQPEETETLCGDDGFDSVKDLQACDAQTFLPDDILVKVDRASMAHSLEVRTPFLDHRLVEYMFSLSPDQILGDGTKKHLLKTVARDLLPDSIIDRKKKGFSAPLDRIGFVEEHEPKLRNSVAAEDGILDQAAIDEFLGGVDAGNRDHANRWLLIMFELWYREWRPT